MTPDWAVLIIMVSMLFVGVVIGWKIRDPEFVSVPAGPSLVPSDIASAPFVPGELVLGPGEHVDDKVFYDILDTLQACGAIVNGQVTWTEYDVEVFPSLNALRDRFGRVTRHRPRPKNPEAPKLWGGIRMEVTGEGETRWFLKVHPVGMKCGVVNVYW